MLLGGLVRRNHGDGGMEVAKRFLGEGEFGGLRRLGLKVSSSLHFDWTFPFTNKGKNFLFKRLLRGGWAQHPHELGFHPTESSGISWHACGARVSRARSPSLLRSRVCWKAKPTQL